MYNFGAPQKCTSCRLSNPVTKFIVTKLLLLNFPGLGLGIGLRLNLLINTILFGYLQPNYLQILCFGTPWNEFA